MLRCSRCGAEFSEWAARCPSCREPAYPVETPSSGAPATEVGGQAGAPRDRPLGGPVVGERPRPVATGSAVRPLGPPAGRNGHLLPVSPVPPVVEPRPAPSRSEPSFPLQAPGPEPPSGSGDASTDGNNGNNGNSKNSENK